MYRVHSKLPPEFRHKLFDLLTEAQAEDMLPDMLAQCIDFAGTQVALEAIGSAMDHKRSLLETEPAH